MPKEPLGERIARLEAIIQNVREDIQAHGESLKSFKQYSYGKFSDIEKVLNEIKASINPRLKSRDKALIIVAVVEGAFALAIALISVYF